MLRSVTHLDAGAEPGFYTGVAQKLSPDGAKGLGIVEGVSPSPTDTLVWNEPQNS